MGFSSELARYTHCRNHEAHLERQRGMSMGRDQKNTGVVVFFLLLAFNDPAIGGEIFRWVDEDGVVTFSDSAPSNATVEISRRTITKTNPPDYDPLDDQFSISRQAERTNVRWSALKARRDELRAQRIEAAQRASQQQSFMYVLDESYPSPIWYGPAYPRRFGHFHKSKKRFHQLHALDRFNAGDGRRPHSINSSAHLARVTASRQANRGLRTRHEMRRPDRIAPQERPSFRDPR